jgi:hypothetical protein
MTSRSGVAAGTRGAPEIAVQLAFSAELFGARLRYSGFATSGEVGATLAGSLADRRGDADADRCAVVDRGVHHRTVRDLLAGVPGRSRVEGRGHHPGRSPLVSRRASIAGARWS